MNAQQKRNKWRDASRKSISGRPKRDVEAKKYQCQNCDFSTDSDLELAEIRDFHSRHKPGDIVADGECPECGCLCYAMQEQPGDVVKSLRLAVWALNNAPLFEVSGQPAQFNDSYKIAAYLSKTLAELDPPVKS